MKRIFTIIMLVMLILTISACTGSITNQIIGDYYFRERFVCKHFLFTFITIQDSVCRNIVWLCEMMWIVLNIKKEKDICLFLFYSLILILFIEEKNLYKDGNFLYNYILAINILENIKKLWKNMWILM